MRLFAGALHVAFLLAVFLISDGQADAANNSREVQLAAAFELPQLSKVPGLPSLTEPPADEIDGVRQSPTVKKSMSVLGEIQGGERRQRNGGEKLL